MEEKPAVTDMMASQAFSADSVGDGDVRATEAEPNADPRISGKEEESGLGESERAAGRAEGELAQLESDDWNQGDHHRRDSEEEIDDIF